MPWIDPPENEQIDEIKAELEYLKRLAKNNRRDLDINSLASIAFIVLLFVGVLFLLSLKGSIGTIQVAPLESLKVLADVLALPAIGAIVTAVTTYLMKKHEH